MVEESREELEWYPWGWKRGWDPESSGRFWPSLEAREVVFHTNGEKAAMWAFMPTRR